MTSRDGLAGGSLDLGRYLLAPDDPAPCRVINPRGGSSFLLVADHAGSRIPARLGDMGLAAVDRGRHIAVDLGVADLAEALVQRLDATAVVQAYSRLVIDCNRDPDRPDAVSEVSDGTVVPANRALPADERAARLAAIHAPYHATLAAELARRDRAGLETVVIALHSFTPALTTGDETAPRPWHAGVLYGGGDERFALAMLDELGSTLEVPVGDNQPYAMDGIDYTVPHHCFAAGRPYAELEIRQDLLTAPGGAGRWSDVLVPALHRALQRVRAGS